MYSVVSGRLLHIFPTVTDVLEFLYGQIHLSYASLNTARSALSCVVYLDNLPASQHQLVRRFLKGVFENKPSPTRQCDIWDVNTVLNYLKTWAPNSSVRLKEFTSKPNMLLALSYHSKKTSIGSSQHYRDLHVEDSFPVCI